MYWLWLFSWWAMVTISPVASPPYGSYLLVSLCSNLSLCLSWLCRYWRQAACVSPGTDSACSCYPCPMCPQSQSMLAFREWTERVIIIIDTLWPSQQVRALRFESRLNVKRLRVGGKRFRLHRQCWREMLPFRHCWCEMPPLHGSIVHARFHARFQRYRSSGSTTLLSRATRSVTFTFAKKS